MASENPKKILIIDDDRTFREVVRHLLEQLEYEVMVAEDGTEGINMIQDERPDVILCDVHMKGMHGYATAQAIKDDPDLESIPIIMVTGSASKLGEKRGRSAGADYYIAKPVRASELTEVMEKAIKNSSDSNPNSSGSSSRSKDFIMG